MNIEYCNKNKAAVMVFGTIVHKIDLERECHAAKWEFKGEEPNELGKTFFYLLINLILRMTRFALGPLVMMSCKFIVSS